MPKLLFFKSIFLMQEDWIESLQHAGYEVDIISHTFKDYLKDDAFATELKKALAKVHYDAVLSFTFCPVISDVCAWAKTPYISWIYDSPIPNFVRFNTPYNHIFHFDKVETEEYITGGCTAIKHLPLAVNVSRLDRQLSPLEEMPEYSHDISFVGNLYEKRSIKTRNFVQPVYIQGILEGYAAAQTQFYNTDIATELLEQSPYLSHLKASTDFPWDYLVRSVHEEATHQERHSLLRKLSRHFSVDLYTTDHITGTDNLHVHPPVDYYTEMPEIFRKSRINLNIGYRTIRSGISARILDVMGSGGFLMTTPQPELFDYFKENEDFVSFSSLDELVDKCHYYLEHEEERHQIAKNGYKKTKKSHTYENRLHDLLMGCLHPLS